MIYNIKRKTRIVINFLFKDRKSVSKKIKDKLFEIKFIKQNKILNLES